MAVLFMYAYMYIRRCGVKKTIRIWIGNFRHHKEFRRIFALAFYVSLVFFRTLLCRDIWWNPLVKLMGTWWIYDDDGKLTTEGIENIILFIPMTGMLIWALRNRIFQGSGVKFVKVILCSAMVSFCFSLSIEFCQLFFKLGTFQFSDLCFNTLGGIIGGAIYWILFRIKHNDKSERRKKWQY